MKITKTTRNVYSKQCEICGKEVKGNSEIHVNWLMKIHQLKHEEPEGEQS